MEPSRRSYKQPTTKIKIKRTKQISLTIETPALILNIIGTISTTSTSNTTNNTHNRKNRKENLLRAVQIASNPHSYEDIVSRLFSAFIESQNPKPNKTKGIIKMILTAPQSHIYKLYWHVRRRILYIPFSYNNSNSLFLIMKTRRTTSAPLKLYSTSTISFTYNTPLTHKPFSYNK